MTLGIRPEDVRIVSGRGGIPAGIDLVEELGGHRVGYCSIGDVEVAVVLPAGTDNLEGRRVNFEFPGEAIHLFDAQSGSRIPVRKAKSNIALPDGLVVPA